MPSSWQLAEWVRPLLFMRIALCGTCKTTLGSDNLRGSRDGRLVSGVASSPTRRSVPSRLAEVFALLVHRDASGVLSRAASVSRHDSNADPSLEKDFLSWNTFGKAGMQ